MKRTLAITGLILSVLTAQALGEGGATTGTGAGKLPGTNPNSPGTTTTAPDTSYITPPPANSWGTTPYNNNSANLPNAAPTNGAGNTTPITPNGIQ